MSRTDRVTCDGYVLHFFDAGLGQHGSDKYYRAFIYQDPTDMQWVSVMAWGRDGTDGQAKLQEFSTEREARSMISKKQTEKIRHGYEKLGSGVTVLPKRPAKVMSAEFHDAVTQREPDKTRMTGGIIIQEEPDLMDLLG